jgi:hypothetical protein
MYCIRNTSISKKNTFLKTEIEENMFQRFLRVTTMLQENTKLQKIQKSKDMWNLN